jgi:hypothetical protein
MNSHRTATAINNVTIKVIDEATGRVDQVHRGKNSVTTTLLEGIAHYLQGYGLSNQGGLLKNNLPQFISLGTMGLNGVGEDSEGNEVQLAQMWEEDNEPVDDIITAHFPEDIPTRRRIPLLASIDGGELLHSGVELKPISNNLYYRLPANHALPATDIKTSGYNKNKIPRRNYFTHAPGFDADIRAEDVMWNLDNNERKVSGIGRPYAQLVQDYIRGYEYVAPTTLTRAETGGTGRTELQVSDVTSYRVGDQIYTRRIGEEDISGPRQVIRIDRTQNLIILQSPFDGNLRPVGTIIFIMADDKENYRRLAVGINRCGDPDCDCTCSCCNEGSSSGSPVPSPLPLECELVTHQHNRVSIQARRAFYPISRSDGMNTAETIRSIDVVYTALISLGALKAMRGNRDYLFITECGLWGQRWSGERYPNNLSIPETLRNRFKAPADLLAGYRVFPKEWSPQDMTDDMWDIPVGETQSYEGERILVTAAQRYRRRVRQLQRSIPRVGKGQVVQVEWKVQLLALDLSRDLFRQDYVTQPDEDLNTDGRTLY